MLQSTARAAQQWQPQRYLAFEGHRLRPALELLGRIPMALDRRPLEIIDLGAGTGNMAPFFFQRWPGLGRLTCVDSSQAMLDRARADHAAAAAAANAGGNDQATGLDPARIAYVQASFEDLAPPPASVDLIYSNAALHWVSAEEHRRLLPRLFSLLKPGGVLAFQIPDTRQQPSHQLMREAARVLGWAEELAHVRWVTCEHDPAFYYDICADLAVAHLDMWATTYAQVMDGDNPVADFTSSTGLGPYLEALGGRGSPRAETFEATYRELVAAAHPKQRDGRTVWNMKRFFLVATKKE